MNKFKEAGIAERKSIELWLKKFLKDKYTVTHTDAEGYDRYDALVRIDTEVPTELVIEAKLRNQYYETQMIEQAKYEQLMEMHKKTNAIPVYLSFNPKGWFAFDLSFIPEPKWENRELIWHTMQPEDGTVMKKVAMLDNKQADFTKL